MGQMQEEDARWPRGNSLGWRRGQLFNVCARLCWRSEANEAAAAGACVMEIMLPHHARGNQPTERPTHSRAPPTTTLAPPAEEVGGRFIRPATSRPTAERQMTARCRPSALIFN